MKKEGEGGGDKRRAKREEEGRGMVKVEEKEE